MARTNEDTESFSLSMRSCVFEHVQMNHFFLITSSDPTFLCGSIAFRLVCVHHSGDRVLVPTLLLDMDFDFSFNMRLYSKAKGNFGIHARARKLR